MVIDPGSHLRAAAQTPALIRSLDGRETWTPGNRSWHGQWNAEQYQEAQCQSTTITKPPSTTMKLQNRIGTPQKPMKRATTRMHPSILK
jgi:hypothetical protein